jgi:hypothetical protein
MITEIVTFKLPDGTTREDVFSIYEKTAPTWRDRIVTLNTQITHRRQYRVLGEVAAMELGDRHPGEHRRRTD